MVFGLIGAAVKGIGAIAGGGGGGGLLQGLLGKGMELAQGAIQNAGAKKAEGGGEAEGGKKAEGGGQEQALAKLMEAVEKSTSPEMLEKLVGKLMEKLEKKGGDKGKIDPKIMEIVKALVDAKKEELAGGGAQPQPGAMV